jgi:hypothetical protein
MIERRKRFKEDVKIIHLDIMAFDDIGDYQSLWIWSWRRRSIGKESWRRMLLQMLFWVFDGSSFEIKRREQLWLTYENLSKRSKSGRHFRVRLQIGESREADWSIRLVWRKRTPVSKVVSFKVSHTCCRRTCLGWLCKKRESSAKWKGKDKSHSWGWEEKEIISGKSRQERHDLSKRDKSCKSLKFKPEILLLHVDEVPDKESLTLT